MVFRYRQLVDFAGYAAVRNLKDQPILGPGESNPSPHPLPQGERKGPKPMRIHKTKRAPSALLFPLLLERGEG